MMNHAAALSAIDELFVGRGKRLPELRAHLDGCVECRAHYDRTARAFRALNGRPEEMTAEELSLFAPAFPEAATAPSRFPIAWIGALAAAATAALVVYVQLESPSEFSPRGSTPVAERSVARALCSRGAGTEVVIADATEGGCSLGDRLAFIASARGHRYVAVALVDLENKVEVVVSGAEGGLAPGNDDEVLAGSTQWRAGLKVMAIYGDTPIDAATAEKCVRGDCPPALEHREIPVERSKP